MEQVYDWEREALVTLVRDEAEELAALLTRIVQLTERITHLRDVLNRLRSSKSGSAIGVDNGMLSLRFKTIPEYISHLDTRVIRLRTALGTIRSAAAGAAIAADNTLIQQHHTR